MATKKTETPAEAKTPRKRSAAPRKTAKWIRNLRGVPVHLRLFGEGRDKPYRIELQRRGTSGDIHQVPAGLTDDGTFVRGVGVLYEVITATEAANTEHTGAGYQPRKQAQIIREQDTVIARTPNWDGKGLAPREPLVVQRPLGPTRIETPGSAALAEDNAALPENAFPPARLER